MPGAYKIYFGMLFTLFFHVLPIFPMLNVCYKLQQMQNVFKLPGAEMASSTCLILCNLSIYTSMSSFGQSTILPSQDTLIKHTCIYCKVFGIIVQ